MKHRIYKIPKYQGKPAKILCNNLGIDSFGDGKFHSGNDWSPQSHRQAPTFHAPCSVPSIWYGLQETHTHTHTREVSDLTKDTQLVNGKKNPCF